MKVIVSFAQEDRELARFSKQAAEVRRVAQRTGIWTSLMLGVFRLMIFGFYTFAFYVGSRLIQHQRYNPRSHSVYDAGLILTVVFAMLMGFVMLASLSPSI